MKKLLEVINLDVEIKKNNILKEINFEIAKGNGIIGMIGLNGAGKTTLIKSLLGYIPVKSGEIKFYENNISFCPDTPEFPPELTASEILKQVLLNRDNKFDKKTILDTLYEVDLLKYGKKNVGAYSRGMKQRLGIAVAIITKPNLIILDEPTSALDPNGRNKIINIISKIGKQTRIIFSSHLLDDIEKISDDLIVMNKGNVIYSGKKNILLSKEAKKVEIEFENLSILNDVIKKINISNTLKTNIIDIKGSKIYFDKRIISDNSEIFFEIINKAESFRYENNSLENAFKNLVENQEKEL